ncbi:MULTISPECIES: IS3 family transposase [unclassified Crossiella]|uniref:IS3 family transposase n=1 Tax=unclassified Crossiella TaxID=2620835 RepID=UPI001FFE3744|nr:MULTISPECIES: IS3 family transposase [unclassified Crossiella]MCK2245508.1 IS3 family transposase [Crossiella sp. S99.2]MCK2259165.1 IS3 family transposase [Crossiella sp. S99.1]
MKVHAVLSLKAEHSLELLLAVSGLARSTFFHHQARQGRPDPQARLKEAITTTFEATRRRGHRVVHHALREAGWRVAKKTVLTLMRELDLVCTIRRRRRYVSYQGTVGAVADNVLNREFTATAPNQKWVTDVTEFGIGDRKVYLSPMMDLFDRQIISYAVSPSPSLELTNSCLRDALATLETGQTPLVHSDQGFQYQHQSWRGLLAEAGATQSMSRKANCYDNAVIESFFGHLKEEMFHHTSYLSIEAFTTALADYITWFNTSRGHTHCEGLSPVRYRAQTLAA